MRALFKWFFCKIKAHRRHFEHVFDVVAELAASSTSDERPFVLWKYPENFDDTSVEKAMLEFSFPLGNA